MEIYNVKALINKTLRDLNYFKVVSPKYPDEMTTFPTAVFSTAHNAYVRDWKGQETDTEWNFTIDLFNKNGSLIDVTNKLIDKFSSMGFSNTVGDQDLSGVVRVAITFTGIVDNINKRVYQKG